MTLLKLECAIYECQTTKRIISNFVKLGYIRTFVTEVYNYYVYFKVVRPKQR